MDNNAVITMMKNERIPLYIWGCGNVAHEVHELLVENDVKIDGCVVDVAIDTASFAGLQIEPLDKVIKRKTDINIVIGHAQYHRGKELDAYENIHHVFCLPNPFKTHENISEEYYQKHIDEYNKALSLFDEPFSRKVFQAYLDAKIYGRMDAVFESFTKPMNFFDNDIWNLTDNEVYVDCGAYNGDTIKMFIKSVSGKYKSIYGFEPDGDIFKVLSENIDRLYENDDRIHLFEKGLWDDNTTLFFSADAEQSGYAQEGVIVSSDEHSIDVCKLDDVVDDKVTLIKINMSGSNKECIEGAAKIISTYRPKVAVTVGLTKERLYQIPILLKKIYPSYNLYLRFNESMPSRICLFAKEEISK